MRPIVTLLALSLCVLIGLAMIRSQRAFAGIKGASSSTSTDSTAVASAPQATVASTASSSARAFVIVSSLTVFALAVFVGFEVIAKVPPTLHTPLMSGSNAISGITVVGAIVIAGFRETGLGSFLGLIAVILAMINVVGGFAVTHRMLLMFKKR